MTRALAGVLLAGLLLLSAPAWAQSSSAGIPVDAHGGPTVDPTKNVLDLVMAAVKRLDDIAAVQGQRVEDRIASNAKYQDALREAETRRLNELAAQKQVFDLELARGIRANVEASALLLAGQVKELKTDTSDRIAKLEVFANEQRGVGTGRSDMYGWLIGGVLFILTLVGTGVAIVTVIVNLRRPSHGQIAYSAPPGWTPPAT